jgi:proteasome activator subunit 4
MLCSMPSTQQSYRHLSLVRDSFAGTPTLVKEIVTDDDIASWHESSDIMHEIPEMIAHMQPINAGFPLTDPNDPRFQYFTALRRRFGQFLHRASESLLRQGEQNTVDGVIILVSC